MMVFVGQWMKQEDVMLIYTIHIQNQKTGVVHFLSYVEEREKKGCPECRNMIQRMVTRGQEREEAERINVKSMIYLV